MVDLFADYFWNVATSVTTLIVPILAIFLLFRLLHDILWRD